MTSALVGLAVFGVALAVLFSRRRAPDLLADHQRPRAGPGRTDSGGLVCGETGLMSALAPGLLLTPYRIDVRLSTQGTEEVISAFRSVVDASQGKCFELPKYQLAERHAARLGRAQLVAMNAHLAKEMRGAPGFRSSREEH